MFQWFALFCSTKGHTSFDRMYLQYVNYYVSSVNLTSADHATLPFPGSFRPLMVLMPSCSHISIHIRNGSETDIRVYFVFVRINVRVSLLVVPDFQTR